jgi:hypothetical protein
MNHLPIYISVVFIMTTLLTATLLYNASTSFKSLIIIITLWLSLQAAISLSGFYFLTTGTPPRFALSIVPPLILIISLVFTKAGKSFVEGLKSPALTLIHIVRIPVELTLYWLFLHQAVPEIMTFDGRNFDILCGITAPFIYYWGHVKNVLSRSVLLAWNIICLLLLINIVSTAILSAPFDFQKFAFDQPNIALVHFPFIWLPSFIVPVVLFAHIINIRRLMKNDDKAI